jgi:ATP-dependent Lhr-like helicase
MNRLPHTYDALLSRFGRLTEIQAQAIGPLLEERNCILVSATASGKTEAALAPLLERQFQRQPRASRSALRTLFVVPTRALTRDLARRLEQPLSKLALKLGVKTGDEPALKQGRPPDILLTTPESLDSLLANRPRLLKDVRAVILDELHLYTDTARGDQLRVLMNRLRRLRSYAFKRGDAEDASVQFCALSATIDAPLRTAARYFAEPALIESKGRRVIDEELLPLESLASLRNLFARLSARGWKKVLAFCRSRAECEELAHHFHGTLPFADRVFAHHANLAARVRHHAEQRFAMLDAALCFATSTLELGIDIGDVDLIVLIGPPDNVSSFLQRIGRGNRRTGRANVACFYRNEREHALFRVFLRQAESGQSLLSDSDTPFRPSVVVQQLFSYLKQTRDGEIEPAPAYELFHTPQGEPLLSARHYEQIIARLLDENYFAPARGAALKPGPKWQELYERRAIYTNLGEPDAIEIVDELTGRKLGYLERGLPLGATFLLGGQAQRAARRTGKRLFVSPTRAASTRFRGWAAARPLSPELARALAIEMGVPLTDNELLLLLAEEPRTEGREQSEPASAVLLHCGGLSYGLALGDLLETAFGVVVEGCDDLSLTLNAPLPTAQLNFTEAQIEACAQKRWRQFESWFAPGAWQKLLPPDVRAAHVVAAFQVAKFQRLFCQDRILTLHLTQREPAD